MSRPWMFFEAGALAKKVDESRVCPLLIDVQPSDVAFPLAAFQLKTTSKEDMRSVAEMINRTRGGEALSAEELAEVFDFRWPLFEAELQKILSESDAEAKHTKTRPDRELLEELLTLTRGIASGGIKVVPEPQLTKNTLRPGKAPTTTVDASPVVAQLLNAVPNKSFLRTLIEQVDNYKIEDDVFVMSFPQEKRSIVEALSSRNNIATIERIINEVQPLKLRLQVGGV